MRNLLCLVLVFAPFLGACATLGPGNPQAEWTTTEGVGDPPVSNIEAPEASEAPVDVWVPYVPIDPPHHREGAHVAENGGSLQAHGGTHAASPTGGSSSSSSSSAPHHAR